MSVLERVGFISLMVALLFGMSWAEAKRYEIPVEGSPSLGPADAPLTIIEFLDYQ